MPSTQHIGTLLLVLLDQQDGVDAANQLNLDAQMAQMLWAVL